MAKCNQLTPLAFKWLIKKLTASDDILHCCSIPRHCSASRRTFAVLYAHTSLSILLYSLREVIACRHVWIAYIIRCTSAVHLQKVTWNASPSTVRTCM